MDLFGIDPSLLQSVLSQAAQSSLAEKLIVVAVVWYMMRKKVSDHFTSITVSLSAIVKSLDELKESVVRLEESHAGRIGKLEGRVDQLEKK